MFSVDLHCLVLKIKKGQEETVGLHCDFLWTSFSSSYLSVGLIIDYLIFRFESFDFSVNTGCLPSGELCLGAFP